MENIHENKENDTRGCLQLSDKIYPVYEGHNTIGRNPDAVINLKNLNVSKTHAVITVMDPDSHYLSDFKSSNGTFLDGRRLSPLQLYKLNNGACIKLGDVICIYKTLDDGKLLRKSLAETQMYCDSFYEASTQEMRRSHIPEAINFNELPTQMFTARDLSINEMPTQLHDNFDDLDDASNDSIDFMTMQKSTESQMFSESTKVLAAQKNKSADDSVTDRVGSAVQPTSNCNSLVEPHADDATRVDVASQGSVIRPVGLNSTIMSDSETDDELTPSAGVNNVAQILGSSPRGDDDAVLPILENHSETDRVESANNKSLVESHANDDTSDNVISQGSVIRPIGRNSKRPSDSEDSDTDDNLAPCSAEIRPVKKGLKKVIESDSDTDEYDFKNEKSKYHISDDSETDVETETKKGSPNRTQKEENSMGSFRLCLSESVDGAGVDQNEESRVTPRLSKKVLPPDHLYCQAFSQTQEQFEKNEEARTEEQEERQCENLRHEDATPTHNEGIDDQKKGQSQDRKQNEESVDSGEKKSDPLRSQTCEKTSSFSMLENDAEVNEDFSDAENEESKNKKDEQVADLAGEESGFQQKEEIPSSKDDDKTSSLPMLENDEDVFAQPTQAYEFDFEKRQPDEEILQSAKEPTEDQEVLKQLNQEDEDHNVKHSEEKTEALDKEFLKPVEDVDIFLQPTQTLDYMKEMTTAPGDRRRLEDFFDDDDDDDIFMQPTQILDKSMNAPRGSHVPKRSSKEVEIDEIFLRPTQAMEDLHGEEPTLRSIPEEDEEEGDTQALEALLADVEESKKVLEEDILPPTQALELLHGEDAIGDMEKSLTEKSDTEDVLPATQALESLLGEDVFRPPAKTSPRRKIAPAKTPVREDDDSFILQPTQALEDLHDDGTPFNKVEDQLQAIFASQNMLCTQELVDCLDRSRDDVVVEDSMMERSRLSMRKEESLTEETMKDILEDIGLQVNRLSGKSGVKTYSKKTPEGKSGGCEPSTSKIAKMKDNAGKGTRRGRSKETGGTSGESGSEDIGENVREDIPEVRKVKIKGRAKRGNLVGAGDKPEVPANIERSKVGKKSDNGNKKKGGKKQKADDQGSKMGGDKESRSSSRKPKMDDQEEKGKSDDQEEKGSKIEGDNESQSNTRSRKKLKLDEQEDKDKGSKAESDKDPQSNPRSRKKQKMEDLEDQEQGSKIESPKEPQSGTRSQRKLKLDEQEDKDKESKAESDKDSQSNARSRKKQKVENLEDKEQGSKFESDKEPQSGTRSRRKLKLDEQEDKDKGESDKESRNNTRSRKNQKVNDPEEKEQGLKVESDTESQASTRSRKKQKPEDLENKEEESDKGAQSSTRSRKKQKMDDSKGKEEKSMVEDDKESQSSTSSRGKQKAVDSVKEKGSKAEGDKDSQKSSTSETSTRRGTRSQNLDASDDRESSVESTPKKTVKKSAPRKSADKDDSGTGKTETEGTKGKRTRKVTLEVIDESNSAGTIKSGRTPNAENEEPPTTRRTRAAPEATPEEAAKRPKRKKDAAADEAAETPTKKRVVAARTPKKRGLKLPSDSEDEFEAKVAKVNRSPAKARGAKQEDVVSVSSASTDRQTVISLSSTDSANKMRRLSANSRRQKREEEKKTTEVAATPERNKRVIKPKVVFTMMDNPELESLIRQLGGSVVDSVDACTVLVTENVKRSQKLLCAVAQGKPVCSPQWLQACKKAYAFVDPWQYLLVDKAAEKKWKFSLRESISRASNAKLLEDHTFQVMVTKANDSEKVLKGAIEACGGKCVTKNLGKCESAHLLVVANENQKTTYTRVAKQNPRIKVVQAEAIFDGTLRQEFNFEDFLLS